MAQNSACCQVSNRSNPYYEWCADDFYNEVPLIADAAMV